MEVQFTPEIQAKLDSTAAANNSNVAAYVQELVEHYVDHDAWFRQKVATGLGQLDRDEFLTHEQVGERLRKLFQS
jgi:predicted transcriptional regulator